MSTPHFDLHENLYLVVNGKKRLLLAPPEVIGQIGVYPLPHPRARQLFIPSLECSSEQAIERLNCSMGRLDPRIIELDLEPGDAVYIPSGWVHEVQSPEASLALSFTASGWEYYENAEFQKQEFLQDLAFRGWSRARAKTILPAYVRGLIAGAGEQVAPFINAWFLGPFDEHVKSELGIILPSSSNDICPKPSLEDEKLGWARGKELGEKHMRFREDVRRIHLHTRVLRIVASFLASEDGPKRESGGEPGTEQVQQFLRESYSQALAFAQRCLAESGSLKS